MLHRFRQRFGTAGLVVAVIALVAALGGTALAAKGALTGKQKKEVTAIAKRYAGTNGTNGSNGANGSPGAAGKEGPQGKEGKAGSNGTNGESVTSQEFEGELGSCKEGGTEFTTASGEAYACNGKEGSPWTDGGTLPPEATESGTFTAGPFGEGTELQEVPISFPIPLSSSATVTPHYIKKPSEGGTTECPAHFISELTELPPQAGNLCVYRLTSVNAAVYTEPGNPEPFFRRGDGDGNGVASTGSFLRVWANESEGEPFHAGAFMLGAWAVTAPEP
jgi:hypothetical protein